MLGNSFNQASLGPSLVLSLHKREQDAQRLHKDSGTLALPKGYSSYIRSEQGSGAEGDDVLWYTGEKFRLYNCPNHHVQVLVLI